MAESSTSQGQRRKWTRKPEPDWEAVAERLFTVLTSPSATQDQRLLLTDMIKELADDSRITIASPEIIHAAFPAMCRSTNGRLRERNSQRKLVLHVLARIDRGETFAGYEKGEGPWGWYRKKHAPPTEPLRQQQAAAPRKASTGIPEGCHLFVRFGLLAGDKIELEEVSDPRSGEVLVLRFNKAWEVGRFVEYDEDEGKRVIVLDQIDGRYEFTLGSTEVYRVSAITRRFTPEEAKGGAREADRERRIAELRGRLDKLTDITDETQRFRIEREVYDLERAVDEDEWPEELAGSEVVR